MGLFAVVGAFYAVVGGCYGVVGVFYATVTVGARALSGLVTPFVARIVVVVGQVEFTPSADGAPGGAMMQKLLNWAGQYGLWGCLASLIVGGGIWGLSQQFGNGLAAGKGKMLAAAGAIGAVIIGLAAVIVNTLFSAASG